MIEGEMALLRISATKPSAAQIRTMYEAEKGMFETGAKVLLQSGTTDAVLDVDVDPVTGNVAVTQTDDAGIWDGLTYTAQTITTGGTTFEHTKLWGNGYVEINDANLGISMPAENLREMAETIRGLGIQTEGVDLSKAAAWAVIVGDGSAIKASNNVESITDIGTGQFEFTWAIPFKTDDTYSIQANCIDSSQANFVMPIGGANQDRTTARISSYTHAGALTDTEFMMIAVFGELEGE
jgi:hypothetical protein